MRNVPHIAVLAFSLQGAALAGDTPTLVWVTSQVSGGNGNGLIDRNECNDFTVTLSNASLTVVTGLWASLGTVTDGAAVSQPDSAYPDLPVGGAATNTALFRISTASWFQAGTPIQVLLAVTNPAGLDERFTFQVNTPVVSTDGTNPCPTFFAFYDSISGDDPVQQGRLLRPRTYPTRCDAPTLCPGVTNIAQQLHYDSFPFINRSGRPACITVTLTPGENCSGGAHLLFSEAYLHGFDPANICANYAGDMYRSPSSLSSENFYGFMVPPSAAFVVVVNEVLPNSGCDNYQVTVSSDTGFIDYTPVLLIGRDEQGAVLTWPTNAWRFTLESSPTLSPSAFTTVTNTPGVDDDDFHLDVAAEREPSRFYRLRRLVW